MNGTTTVSLVGVGGQGVLLATNILAQTAMADGYDVKASEVKGMAQRGGSVLSTVRFGKLVWSPLARHADIVIALELLEGRRALPLLPPQGALVCARTVIAPGNVLRRETEYPQDIEAAAAARSVALVLVDAEAVAREAGTVRAANVALLGAASVKLPFGEPAWQQGLASAIPAKILEVNQRAFALGREAHLQEEVRQ